MASRIELFAFRYRCPRTGKWIRARYRAEWSEIAQRYTEWEITGPAEVREVDPNARVWSAIIRATSISVSGVCKHGLTLA